VSVGAWMMLLVTLIVVGTLGFLIFATARSIQTQRTKGRSIWREFALGLILMILFLVTWVGQGITEWQVFTDEQQSHGETPEVGNFLSEYAQSTLENWQSEFLQLFSFVTLAALFIHKGSAESKDSDEKLEASLRRIEEHLGTLPSNAPQDPAERWQLPHTPLDVADSSA
jgi:succinate dehydrogenase hydrophobic anchor subunit